MPGGVCAVLDYDVEVMAEYIAEMATRLVLPGVNVSASFRKFVSSILSSTRLPSTTILLGMNYLSKRTGRMPAAGHGTVSEDRLWRMLTVALLLGSKFLDDNTFQNKSWSDVSGIPVRELNVLECEWLGEIDWTLYVNLDESKDYTAWLKNWQDWQDNKKRQQVQTTRERLASLVPPIDTDVTRLRNPHSYPAWYQQQVAEYERLSNMKRNASAVASNYRRDSLWSHVYPSWQTPLTPPDSGYGTPEYANSATSSNARYNEWVDRATHTQAASRRQPPQPQFQQGPAYHSYHQHSSQNVRHQTSWPYYNYSHGMWEHSPVEWGCVNCVSPAHKQQPYFASHAYGQPVMG